MVGFVLGLRPASAISVFGQVAPDVRVDLLEVDLLELVWYEGAEAIHDGRADVGYLREPFDATGLRAWVASVPSELPLILFVMPIAWRAAAESFEQLLRKHGVPPAAVTDVEEAWRAFGEFSQTEIGGVAPADEDGDGFIIQWGRRSWGDNRLLLTLTRQLAVVDLGDRDDPDWQAELWQVELEIAFDDEPALVALEPGLDAPDTGFRFDPIGPLRAVALAEARVQAQRQPLVRAMWTAIPLSSGLRFECAC